MGALGPRPLPLPQRLLSQPSWWHILREGDSSAVHLFLWKPGFLGRLQGGWERSYRTGMGKMSQPHRICCQGSAWTATPLILLITVLWGVHTRDQAPPLPFLSVSDHNPVS